MTFQYLVSMLSDILCFLQSTKTIKSTLLTFQCGQCNMKLYLWPKLLCYDSVGKCGFLNSKELMLRNGMCSYYATHEITQK